MIFMWVLLTILCLGFILIDLGINTPESGVMKAGWILVIVYTGPIGLFFYFLSCRQPMPGTHEAFIRPLWKQALGSEVHCLAGDATGIIVAAIFLSFYELHAWVEIVIEYLAGFGFGWLIFQSLFMKGMMGGSYKKALMSTFMPEWLSMNMIMAGMIPVMVIWDKIQPLAKDPSHLYFWGKMSLAALVGGLFAYGINHWLVKMGIKHGMTTVYKNKKGEKKIEMQHVKKKVKPSQLFYASLLTSFGLTLGILVGILGQLL